MKSGWFNESRRHKLARLGIKTGRKAYSKVGRGVIALKDNGMFYPKQKLDYKVLSSSEFRVNDNTTIVCRSEDTRSGFRHIADLYRDGSLVESAKATYLNRTWEKYEFQSVISELLNKAGYNEKEQDKIMNKIENKSLGKSDEMFKSIGMVASLGEIMGKTDKEKNAWKLRMIKAGLGSKGFQEPEDWDTLPEKEKAKRLDKVIKFMKEKKVNYTKEDFFRDKAGKISSKMLSPYGKRQLKQLDGVQLFFTDSTLTIKGNELVDKAGKTIMKIDNDRLVNKIIFKVI